LSRSTSAGARKAAIRASEHLERSEAWNGLRAGDPVVVSGLAMRGASWAFRAHVRNHHNDTESIEVIGGRPGDRTIRSFEPHRVFAVTGSRKRRSPANAVSGELSLADAPQLPLG
jgi:hypothetical protein